MSKQEILSCIEVNDEYSSIPISKINAAIRKNELKAVKRGRSYFITRKDLNMWLGIENSEDLLNKDYEIQRLKDSIKGYQMKLETFKGLLATLNQIADI